MQDLPGVVKHSTVLRPSFGRRGAGANWEAFSQLSSLAWSGLVQKYQLYCGRPHIRPSRMALTQDIQDAKSHSETFKCFLWGQMCFGKATLRFGYSVQRPRSLPELISSGAEDWGCKPHGPNFLQSLKHATCRILYCHFTLRRLQQLVLCVDVSRLA